MLEKINAMSKWPFPKAGEQHQALVLADALVSRRRSTIRQHARDENDAIAEQLRRIPELEADYKRLMDKHNALHVNAQQSRAELTALGAQGARVPEGWEIRLDDGWIYFKRPDGFCQAVTPNNPQDSHAQTLYALMCAMLSSAPTAPEVESVRHWTESEPVRIASSRVGRVYIAGPMTGIAEFNFPAFNAEAAKLRAEGLTVLNPAEHGIVDGAEWADYLRHDIAGLASCERIHFLPGWANSKGARLECAIAEALGMTMTHATHPTEGAKV